MYFFVKLFHVDWEAVVRMKTISILGSTGSIGRQALEVIENRKDSFRVLALAAGNNIDLIRKQILQFNPEIISVKNPVHSELLKEEFKNLTVISGNEGLLEIAGDKRNDIVLIAVTGITGLFPTLKAIENGITVALANKETLVAAGSIVMKEAAKHKVKIIPVDSEHSAIFQCLQGQDEKAINKLIITASGGPFRTKTIEEIRNATVEQTLSHPKWSMGNKITVDSATLMNKGLEVIEAHWLFHTEYKNIEVVIHPQSILHSAVEFADGSVIGQMGLPSMHIPIQYALTWPERIEGIKTNTLSLSKIAKLEFEEPNFEKFPCLKLAFEAGTTGGTCPTALNAANEEAVTAFLKNKIKLHEIYEIVEKTIDRHEYINAPNMQQILNVDIEARRIAKEFIQRK